MFLLTLSCSSLSMNATGRPCRFPDGEVMGVFMSAWASTQMRHKSGLCWAWPPTDPMARLCKEVSLINIWWLYQSNSWAGTCPCTVQALTLIDVQEPLYAVLVTCDRLPAWRVCAQRRQLCSLRHSASYWLHLHCEGTLHPCRVHPSQSGGSRGHQSHARSSLEDKKDKKPPWIKELDALKALSRVKLLGGQTERDADDLSNHSVVWF